MTSNINWSDFLDGYQNSGVGLFSVALMKRWGSETWAPCEEDRKAAGRLHTQVSSRISTQRLGYRDGDEQAALKSVYELFETTRNIVDEFHGCRHFDALAWDVLNTQVRPFTAKWHPQSLRGALSALDATDEFRAELAKLQEILRNFDDFLVHLRDGQPPPRLDGQGFAGLEITTEMNQELPCGIHPVLGGIGAEKMAKPINHAEARAIKARRKQYASKEEDPKARQKATEAVNKPHAVALALSGGGIRSATFALGVLVALARRNILPQVDYLSTVSGGGYLGSFLTTFLSSPGRDDIGLQADKLPFERKAGEAEALRHIRHHSKYLVTGSWWQRVMAGCTQLYGMLLNGLGIVLIVALFASIEGLLRMMPLNWAAPIVIVSTLCVLLAAVLSLRPRKTSWWRTTDVVVTVLTVASLLVLVWYALWLVHEWVHLISGRSWSGSVGDPKTWVAIGGAVTAAIPVINSVFAGGVDRLMKRSGIILVVLTAIAVPIFLFGLYLAMYEWLDMPPIVTPWGLVPAYYVLWLPIGLVALLYYFLLNINFTSPHRYYRQKLAEAYLIRPKAEESSSPQSGQHVYWPLPSRDQLAKRPFALDQSATVEHSATEQKTDVPAFDSAVSMRLSDLIRQKPHVTPYHLINCALNVPGSRNLKMQGRLADFFLFSPAFSGSPLIGYWPTIKWEAVDQRLDLATMMAISGAATAPQMGLGTVRRFSFWLALLNVRLGYWLRKPNTTKKDLRWYGPSPGLWFLLKEMLGTMHEKLPWINVSDGGHIENLGVYELLRRRCKYIIAVDGEQDSKMTFQALTTLQRLAAIDFGIQIDINLDDLRLNEKGLTRSHFHFCRIQYPIGNRDSEERMIGYLLYLKLSLTGNEGEFIRRYRLDEPAFPHHSTADQLFTEAQFEAYRTLGEHVGDKLFLKAIVGEEMAASHRINVEDWFLAMGNSLLEPRPDLIRESHGSQTASGASAGTPSA